MDLPPIVDEHLATPPRGTTSNGTGVLVLSGSSGRIETERAGVFAATGVTALTYRWFGGPDQPPGICEYPLEAFGHGVDRLAAECDRVVLCGSSKTAEAFLLYAAHDPRVDAVVALAPSSVAWANVGPDRDGKLRPQRSSWTLGGEPVPFVPYDDDFATPGDPPEYVHSYRHSLATYPNRVTAARIPAERFFGDVLLVAGGDDRVWPAHDFAREVEARRAAYQLPSTVVTHPRAGHRVVLPGERPAAGGQHMARGGSDAADRELGDLAWPHLLRVLGAS